MQCLARLFPRRLLPLRHHRCIYANHVTIALSDSLSLGPAEPRNTPLWCGGIESRTLEPGKFELGILDLVGRHIGHGEKFMLRDRRRALEPAIETSPPAG